MTSGQQSAGELKGLFVLNGQRGAALPVAVGRGHIATASLGPEALRAFLTARIAVARWLEWPAGCAVSPHGPWLRQIVPTFPQEALGVDGGSVGLAYALALISELASIPLLNGLYATGGISPEPNVSSNYDMAMTQLKLEAVSRLKPARVLIPKEDWTQLPSNWRQKRWLIGVDDIDHAIELAFDGRAKEVVDTLTRVAPAMETEHLTRPEREAGQLLWQEFRAGVRYCGSDPLLFLAISVYFAFCAAHHQACRSPEDWPLLTNDTEVPGIAGAKGFAGFVSYIKNSVPEDGLLTLTQGQARRLLDQVPKVLGQVIRDEINYLPAPDALDLRGFFDLVNNRRHLFLKNLPNEIATSVGGHDRLQLNQEFQDFERLIKLLCGQFAGGPLLEIMGRRAKMTLSTSGDLASEQVIKAGRGLLNMTLGGAWLVRLGYDYMQSNCPDLCPKWYEDAFEIRRKNPDDPVPDVPFDEFIQGIADGIAEHAAFALLVEHPFHPRVLWEVLPRTDGKASNVRYPAEKFVLRRFFQVLFRNELKRQHRQRRALLFWSHEMLPMVGPAETDELTADAPVGIPRIGDVAVSEYAAFGRTNQYNLFLDVNALGEILSARVENEALPGLVIPEAAWRSGFLWAAGKPPSDTSLLSVVNARTSAVNVSEFVRRQMQMNRLLDMSPDAIKSLGPAELLCLPWWSIRPSGTALDEYVWGRGGALARGKRRDSVFPFFADPYTWRGIGVATLMAYEATIGAVMLSTLRDLWRRSPKASQERMQYQLSLRECAQYSRDEFVPTAIPKMLALIARVEKLIVTQSAVEMRELNKAAERIRQARRILESSVNEIDTDMLGSWEGIR